LFYPWLQMRALMLLALLALLCCGTSGLVGPPFAADDAGLISPAQSDQLNESAGYLNFSSGGILPYRPSDVLAKYKTVVNTTPS
jgi:hypothetical protein